MNSAAAKPAIDPQMVIRDAVNKAEGVVEFSPGDWTLTEMGSILDSRGRLLARLHGGMGSIEGNGRLMARAPNLFARLICMLQALEPMMLNAPIDREAVRRLSREIVLAQEEVLRQVPLRKTSFTVCGLKNASRETVEALAMAAEAAAKQKVRP
jgi:hypothetical protein